MTLTLQSLENLFETIQTRLAHAVQRRAAFALPEVGRSVRAGGVENIRFAEHVLDHEVRTLRESGQRNDELKISSV